MIISTRSCLLLHITIHLPDSDIRYTKCSSNSIKASNTCEACLIMFCCAHCFYHKLLCNSYNYSSELQSNRSHFPQHFHFASRTRGYRVCDTTTITSCIPCACGLGIPWVSPHPLVKCKPIAHISSSSSTTY